MVSRKKVKTTNKISVEKTIVEFLRTKDVPYSEPRLIRELFKINEQDEEMPASRKDLEKIQRIKEILRRLVKEKKIYTARFEDYDTREQVPHYSAKGWYVTP